MIRDRIVVGICDQALSQRMQLDPDLTLEKVNTFSRQREAVREHQEILGNSTSAGSSAKVTSIDQVHKSSHKGKKPQSPLLQDNSLASHAQDVREALTLANNALPETYSATSAGIRGTLLLIAGPNPSQKSRTPPWLRKNWTTLLTRAHSARKTAMFGHVTYRSMVRT